MLKYSMVNFICNKLSVFPHYSMAIATKWYEKTADRIHLIQCGGGDGGWLVDWMAGWYSCCVRQGDD